MCLSYHWSYCKQHLLQWAQQNYSDVKWFLKQKRIDLTEVEVSVAYEQLQMGTAGNIPRRFRTENKVCTLVLSVV